MLILPAARHAFRAIARPEDRDCCLFALAVLTRAYSLPPPTPELEALWEIHRDPNGRVPLDRVWGPVDAAVQVGIGRRLAPREAPATAGWYLCQGWSRVEGDGTVDPSHPYTHGHTWLWRYVEGDDGFVLDSTRTRGPTMRGFDAWPERRRVYAGGVAVAALRPTH